MNWNLTLDRVQLRRLRTVTSNANEIFLYSDYFLECSITSLPENPDEEIVLTGMKWH